MLIERKPYMNKLRSWRDEHIVKVVTGVRRCGKSTLLEMLADEIRQDVDETQIQFMNFEDPDVYTIGDWKQIYDFIKVKIVPDKMNYIFLDEVQNIPVFERLVDGLFIKKNVDLYVTGSNGYLLSGELATLLTGRYIEISMLPFSFAEYIEATSNFQKPLNNKELVDLQKAHWPNLTKNESLASDQNHKDLHSPNVTKDESLAKYIYEGSLPQAVSLFINKPEQTTEFLSGVLNTIIEKDVLTRHTINNQQAFYKVLDFVLDSVGSIVSPRSISDTLRSNDIIVNKLTVGNYLHYLCEAFFLYKVSRYDLKGKGLLQTLDKYYVADTGFRKVRLDKKPSADEGHLLENAVYLELRRRYPKVYIGKIRDNEVDFVAVDRKGYTAYYQVALSTKDEATLERELKPLKAIHDSNPKYLLTTDWDGDPVYDGIRKLNVINWLLAETVGVS